MESLQGLIYLLRNLNCTSIFFNWRMRGECGILQLSTEGKLVLKEEKRRTHSVQTAFSALLLRNEEKLFLSTCQHSEIIAEQIRMWLNNILSIIPLFEVLKFFLAVKLNPLLTYTKAGCPHKELVQSKYAKLTRPQCKVLHQSSLPMSFLLFTELNYQDFFLPIPVIRRQTRMPVRYIQVMQSHSELSIQNNPYI